MSSHKRSRVLQSPKFVDKKRKKRLGIIFLISLCIAIVAAAVILFLRIPFLQISKIQVEGATTLDAMQIQNAALATLSGSYINIIPRSNIFFFPKDEIVKVLEDGFKEINGLSIHRTGLGKITIKLAERVPDAVACSGFYEEDPSDEECYYVDSKGYVFAKIATSTDSLADSSTKATFTHYYVPPDQNDIVAGVAFMDEKHFKDMQKFVIGAGQGGLVPLGILVGDGGDYEMYIKNKFPSATTTETTVYFDDKTPFESTLSNLLAFWRNSAQEAKGKGGFDYINLRFGNTIYYSVQ